MTQENTNIFGEWLKAILKDKRLSGGEFSQRSKISRAAVYFYLDGKRIPDEETLGKIVSALGVTPESVPVFERKPIGRRRVLRSVLQS